MALTDSVRRQLMELARAAMDAAVTRQPRPRLQNGLTVDAFGVFVTVHHCGDLRGCLGALDCRDSIVESVARLAAAVTSEDYRFAPLTVRELPHTTIDLSLLTIPEPVEDILHIEIGRHGLIIEEGRRRGLLLPQVAPEHGWDRETFLEHTCVKAGLPTSAWKNGARLLCFEAEIVRELRAAGSSARRNTY